MELATVHVKTNQNAMMALDVSDGKTLWSYRAPAQVGGGASIVNGRVLWGYGFTLFSGAGQGGIISFAVSAVGRVQQERGGTAGTSAGSASLTNHTDDLDHA